ncbi:MAG: molybdopterin-synthase adenylyltransferase MoeB [Gammaproteobacteria bacterium]|nr:molybdopterin-synthase adenylyltransferase MoeB [Gammaproteobacteria bacterium]
MDDQRLLRYSRQILLPEIDISGQQRLLESAVAVFGLGGLGSPVALYLAAAGVGRLVLVDFDEVELSNLQRQIIHLTADLGRPKVESARDRLRALNPEVRVDTVPRLLASAALDELIEDVDLVVDCTDNFPTRFGLNAACWRARKPLVSGAAIRFEGQVSVYFPGQGDSPCYRCLYDDGPGTTETCSQTGVVAPLLGIIGSVQALETIKVLTGIGEPLTGRLLVLDGLRMEWRNLRFKRAPDCPVCGQQPPT